MNTTRQKETDTIVGDFNAQFSSLYKAFRPKKNRNNNNNKETSEFNYTIEKMDLTNIYKIFYPWVAEYIFFSSVHGIFYKGDHIKQILANKRS
jgi:hypothetical protein